MTTATATRRLINQFSENISLEDAIALATGEALPMFKSFSWDVEDEYTEDGIMYSTLCDSDDWQALIDEYTLTSADIAAFRADFEQEAIAEMEEDLEPQELAELARMTDSEIAALVVDDVRDKLGNWLEAFNSEALEAYAQYSCRLNAWENLTCNLL